MPGRSQSTNSIPSLKLPIVALTNASSSIPSNALNAWIGGIVASPTPTVPISSDSTSVIATLCVPSTRATAAAAIHPAVPPPMIAMLRKARSLMPRSAP